MVAFRLHPYYMLFIQFCKPLVLIFKNLFISYCLQSTAKTYGFALYFNFVYLLFCINHGVKGGVFGLEKNGIAGRFYCFSSTSFRNSFPVAKASATARC
nr:MAG TPA: hypothetical protein [Caudoviricetes sp.]